MFLPARRVLGANDKVRLAVVGLRWKGGEHVAALLKIPGVEVATLCDVDPKMLERDLDKITKAGRTATTCSDLRKVLDDKSIDGIVVATPNHWHALATIWACQAGKDVYVEKPVSHTIWEGRKMIEAARKYQRIVQAGTQTRSDQGVPALIEYLRAGQLGKIQHIHAIIYNHRPSIGKVNGPQPVPPGVDYDLWCGPAPKGPILRKQFHYDWHWQWLYGGGECANNGPHYLDVCRWVLGHKDLAPRVFSLGGRVGYVDDGETYNTQIALLDYQPAPVILEVRGLPRKAADKDAMDTYRGIRMGFIIQCEGGHYGGSLSGGWTYDKDGKKLKQFTQRGPETHQANFVDAMRSRKVGDLKAEIADGHLSTALCHMANISNRLGKAMGPDQIKEALKSDARLGEAFQRVQAHLAANHVDLTTTPLQVGPVLTMDSAAESFTGDRAAEANAFLRRQYREPFAIREHV